MVSSVGLKLADEMLDNGMPVRSMSLVGVEVLLPTFSPVMLPLKAAEMLEPAIASVPDVPTKVALIAAPPDETYSVPPLIVVLLAVAPASTTCEPVNTVTPLARP